MNDNYSNISDNLDNSNDNSENRQPPFFFGMPSGAGGFPGMPFFQPGSQQMQPPFGQPPYGQPPFGQSSYGQPPFGQSPFGQPSYGQPPFGQSPFGQPSYGQPPFGQPPSGPPSGPPPAFVPSQASAQQTVGVSAVDPGAIRPCVFRYVYIWLVNGRQFWAWLVFVGRVSAAGWRWTGYNWVYFGVDLSEISAFVCY